MPGRAVLSPANFPSLERWAPARLPLDAWTVLRLARYRRPADVAPAIWDTAQRMVARAGELIEPAAVLATVRVGGADAGGGAVVGGIRFTGRAVGRLLAGCPRAVAFALTAGPRLEADVAALNRQGQLLESYLLDTAGWAAIERGVRALRLDLRSRLADAGWRPTHRLAPGYGDWPLAEQPALLSLLAGSDPPVRLSEHGVLLPFKSITGLFGLRPTPDG